MNQDIYTVSQVLNQYYQDEEREREQLPSLRNLMYALSFHSQLLIRANSRKFQH